MDQSPDPGRRLPERVAGDILDAFHRFQKDFGRLTHRAQQRFARQQWAAMQRDALKRLDLHTAAVANTLKALRAHAGSSISSLELWKQVRQDYIALLPGETNEELARTFFNSITRKVFSTVGVNPEIEFFSLRPSPSITTDESLYSCHERPTDRTALIRDILSSLSPLHFQDIQADALLAASQIDRDLAERGIDEVDAAEVLRPVFYRNKGAYVVGRLRCGGQIVPLVLALVQSPAGARLDAVLMDAAGVSILFSFAWSYFHVESERPSDLVAFLRTIMPLKPVSDIWSSLGFHKHGKTELYRAIRAHLSRSGDHFEFAPGERGLVMIAFTLRRYDVVFKVIRDRFSQPKHTSRRKVMEQYRLVFQRDRVGRLVDAQEFEHLEFPRELFADDLLQELTSEGSRTVRLENGEVVIDHLYAERKVTPLNLYLERADPTTARLAVIDYGNAIRELAKANIFPGDLFFKNFGVTRHGRVVFYDYDELCLLSDCVFRRLPPPRNYDEALAAEPWFRVGENDIFPEEFETFLELSGKLREIFLESHGDLFTVKFWQNFQELNREGEIMEFFPYRDNKRLRSETP